jgi:hypothetical protein
MLLFRLLVASTCCVLTALAHAQVRSIPGDAKRGEIRHVQEAIVSIDGVQQRLAPGAQIRDQDNRLLVPTAVPAGAQVRYLLNDQGQVRQVWILTPAEAKRQAVKKEAAKN